MQAKTALITGGARRIGAAITHALHAAGMDVIIHCHRSVAEAEALAANLNRARAGSARVLNQDLRPASGPEKLVEQCHALDVLINNASTFYPTPLAEATAAQWDELLDTNLRAPFFLAQAAAPLLRRRQGCIVNLTDIHAQRPLRDHAIYSISKAALDMLTKALAKELAPEVRVNGIAPGAAMWPEQMDADLRQRIESHTMLKRAGTPEDVAAAVRFLVCDAPYVTGQILAVDGGRTLYS
ncbi:MAG: pteridine reductase [Gammaproteobacteria bacterium RIFCSPLOWO2_02_FULL_61_13]|nr:MAG: pteridine reductase [Gammaproteobacteria bacterium RIFCSPLOWO2_02_FULL_61_13]